MKTQAQSEPNPSAGEYGALLAEVRPPMGRQVFLLGLFGQFLLILLFLLVVALEARASGDTLLIGLLLLCVTLLVGILVLMARERLCVYEFGVARRNRWGEVRLAYREVVSILHTDEGVVLCGKRGKEIGTQGLHHEKARQAMSLAVDLCLPLLLERALETLRTGGRVLFGEVAVLWEGLVLPSGRFFPWSEIRRARLEEGKAAVFIRDRPADAFLLPRSTPNLPLFVRLCECLPMLAAVRTPPETTPKEIHENPEAITTQPARATVTTFPPAVEVDEDAPADTGPVEGFPVEDPELGPFVYGRSSCKGVLRASLVLALTCAVLCPASCVWPALVHSGGYVGLMLMLPLVLFVILAHGRRNELDVSILVGLSGMVGMLVLSIPALCLPEGDGRLLAPILAVLWALLALSGMGAFLDTGYRGFAVYQGGVRVGRHGLRWSDCLHLRYDSLLGKLELEGEKVLRIRGADIRTRAACQGILDRVLPVLVEKARKIVDEGGVFAVGGVRVTGQGVEFRGRRVPWASVRQVEPRESRIVLWTAGPEPFLRVDLDRRDALVLLYLLSEMAGGRVEWPAEGGRGRSGGRYRTR
jgi:hypothetical protein